eukprot:PhM_4_TR10013/c2_g2_i2/m.34879
MFILFHRIKENFKPLLLLNMSLRSFESVDSSDATFTPGSDPDTEYESSSDSSLDSDSTLADDEVYDDQYLLPHQDFLEAAGDRWNLPRRNGEGIVEFESRLKQALEALGDESDSTSNAQSTDDEEGDDDLWPFVAHRLSKSMTRLNSESDENVFDGLERETSASPSIRAPSQERGPVEGDAEFGYGFCQCCDMVAASAQQDKVHYLHSLQQLQAENKKEKKERQALSRKVRRLEEQVKTLTDERDDAVQQVNVLKAEIAHKDAVIASLTQEVAALKTRDRELMNSLHLANREIILLTEQMKKMKMKKTVVQLEKKCMPQKHFFKFCVFHPSQQKNKKRTKSQK